jgi:hypothetical protein
MYFLVHFMCSDPLDENKNFFLGKPFLIYIFLSTNGLIRSHSFDSKCLCLCSIKLFNAYLIIIVVFVVRNPPHTLQIKFCD